MTFNNTYVSTIWTNHIYKIGKLCILTFSIKFGTSIAGWSTTTIGTLPSDMLPVENAGIHILSRSSISVDVNINTTGSFYLYLPSNGAIAASDVITGQIVYIIKS